MQVIHHDTDAGLQQKISDFSLFFVFVTYCHLLVIEYGSTQRKLDNSLFQIEQPNLIWVTHSDFGDHKYQLVLVICQALCLAKDKQIE